MTELNHLVRAFYSCGQNCFIEHFLCVVAGEVDFV